MGRRWLAPAAALAVAAGFPAAPAAAGPPVIVDAYVDGALSEHFTAADLGAPDVTGTTYDVRGRAGDDPAPAGATSGWSIVHKVLDPLGVTAQAVDVVGSGTAYTLDRRADLSDPSDF